MENLTEEKKKIKEGFVGQKMIVLPPDIKKLVTKNPLIKDLYITAIGYYPNANHHHRERKNGSLQHILLYCVEGSGYIHMGRKNYELKPNSYFIVPKGVAHRYGSNDEAPWSIYWIHFSGENANILYSRYTHDAEPEVLVIPYDEDRIKLFDLIFNMLENNYSIRNLELINIKLLEYLSSLIYHEEMYPSYYTEDPINSSIEFMKESLDHTYSIKELADKLGYSVSHYSALFKKKTGVSPIHYYIQLKIQKSCQYLYFTNMNIKEICNKIGFDDPYYFSRMFKKMMGSSPAKYRSHHKK